MIKSLDRIGGAADPFDEVLLVGVGSECCIVHQFQHLVQSCQLQLLMDTEGAFHLLPLVVP